MGFSLFVAYELNCSEACGLLVLQPGTEAVSPALEGRFLTAGPPGQSPDCLVLIPALSLTKLRLVSVHR